MDFGADQGERRRFSGDYKKKSCVVCNNFFKLKLFTVNSLFLVFGLSGVFAHNFNIGRDTKAVGLGARHIKRYFKG